MGILAGGVWDVAEFHDFWMLHVGNGNIHCATATIREVPTNPPWWEQVETWE